MTVIALVASTMRSVRGGNTAVVIVDECELNENCCSGMWSLDRGDSLAMVFGSIVLLYQ